METEGGGVPALAVGRGRGRGAGRGGGVAVLPQGLWDELSGLGGDKANEEPDTHTSVHNETYGERDVSNDATDRQDGPDFSNANEEDNYIPMGFGRGRQPGRGAGRGGRGTAGGRGRGLDKDLKGPDWTCPSCTNVNWSWRSNCNKCQTFKPISALAEHEIRDGAGGGFNERQGRVSAANVEITEDGFDDFGRRAKGRSEDKRAKEAAALARLNSNYGFLLNPEALQQGMDNVKTDSLSAQFADAERSGGHANGTIRELNSGSNLRDDDRNRNKPSSHTESNVRSAPQRARSRSRDRDQHRDSRRRDDRGADRRDHDRARDRVDDDRSRDYNDRSRDRESGRDGPRSSGGSRHDSSNGDRQNGGRHDDRRSSDDRYNRR